MLHWRRSPCRSWGGGRGNWKSGGVAGCLSTTRSCINTAARIVITFPPPYAPCRASKRRNAQPHAHQLSPPGDRPGITSLPCREVAECRNEMYMCGDQQPARLLLDDCARLPFQRRDRGPKQRTSHHTLGAECMHTHSTLARSLHVCTAITLCDSKAVDLCTIASHPPPNHTTTTHQVQTRLDSYIHSWKQAHPHFPSPAAQLTLFQNAATQAMTPVPMSEISFN